MVVLKFGSPTWARTRDLRINSPSLYRLSYRGKEARILERRGGVVNRNLAWMRKFFNSLYANLKIRYKYSTLYCDVI